MFEVNSRPRSLPQPASLQDSAEEQLQQELRSMFAVDTQAYLQTYINLAQKLQPDSWTADIQELYRCVHTIKGGAVTVGADGILHVSTVLEDLLSDLRYLQTAPPLADENLAQMLLEAGELLTASLQVQAVGEAALLVVQPSIERILVLREQIQQLYLPELNERTQLFQEFAEQGFDLVVLDLEMLIEQLPGQGEFPTATVKKAKQTLQQLLQIGKDLEFEPGWIQLLRHSKVLLNRLESDFWQAQWPPYLRQLKDCARKGGKVSSSAGKGGKGAEEQRSYPKSEIQNSPATSNAQLPNSTELLTNTQIPVPLERLERSSQYLVETLLSARAAQGHYKSMQTQLAQLLSLAQDSVQHITRLRQVQDDYALLDNLQEDRSSITTGPTLERYRQGYTIINRLLEISLRLSELGAETATSARQTNDNLQTLDRNILNLQQTVEESRLIPFKMLGFRAKGILRDLTNRYNKPAQLVVQGENIELDAGTVQKLEPALLHLLRNAYDHALETPAERIALGKPEQGTIILSLRRQGKSYLLDLQDDGRGIDAKAIAQLAQAKELPLTRTDTLSDLLAVICQPGFSSQQNVSDVSGRGVGMDVVAAQIARLNGRLSLDTTPKAGTTFHMQIPVPQLLVRCVLVRAGDRVFAIPSEEIVTTTLWSYLSATRVEPSISIGQQMPCHYSWHQHEGETAPALDLLQYWQPGGTRSLPDTAICMRIRSASATSKQDAWLLADDLLEQLDLLISPLPHPLIAPLGLMGASLQANGKLIPVLEPATLAAGLWGSSATGSRLNRVESNSGAAIAASTAQPQREQASTANILVVDDAALVRRRIEASLTAYGYIVHTCRDGMEAWNWLQSNNPPAMLITDIEMPEMDGFTLIDRCRQDGMNLPIIVVSSRLSEEWGKEARRLGATDYLTKGFTTAELLSKVNQFIALSAKR